jgi:hypothetical protein
LGIDLGEVFSKVPEQAKLFLSTGEDIGEIYGTGGSVPSLVRMPMAVRFLALMKSLDDSVELCTDNWMSLMRILYGNHFGVGVFSPWVSLVVGRDRDGVLGLDKRL